MRNIHFANKLAREEGKPSIAFQALSFLKQFTKQVKEKVLTQVVSYSHRSYCRRKTASKETTDSGNLTDSLLISCELCTKVKDISSF